MTTHRAPTTKGPARKALAGLALGGILALAATVAGCTAESQPASSPTWATTVQAPEPPANVDAVYGSQDTNDRGNRTKTIGQPAGLQNADGSMLVDFAVTGIRKVNCPSRDFPADNGRFVAVDMVATTYNDPDKRLSGMFFSYGWEHVTEDGVSTRADTSPASVCSSEVAEAPAELRPNRKYTMTVVLDVPPAGGSIVWTDTWVAGGWEWSLPLT